MRLQIGMTMNDQAYAAIRQEMTQTFSTFRQLTMAQYAAYPVLLAALMNATTVGATLLFASLLAALVVVVTVLGRSWFLQAVRQASYILVAFELPALAATPDGDRAGYWILANRSFARYLKTDRRDTFHFPSRELRHFLVQQLVLAGVAVVVVVLLALIDPGRQLQALSLDARPYAAPAIVVPPLCAVLYVARELSGADTILHDITRAWLEYARERPKHDDAYLHDIGYIAKQ